MNKFFQKSNFTSKSIFLSVLALLMGQSVLCMDLEIIGKRKNTFETSTQAKRVKLNNEQQNFPPEIEIKIANKIIRDTDFIDYIKNHNGKLSTIRLDKYLEDDTAECWCDFGGFRFQNRYDQGFFYVRDYNTDDPYYVMYFVDRKKIDIFGNEWWSSTYEVCMTIPWEIYINKDKSVLFWRENDKYREFFDLRTKKHLMERPWRQQNNLEELGVWDHSVLVSKKIKSHPNNQSLFYVEVEIRDRCPEKNKKKLLTWLQNNLLIMQAVVICKIYKAKQRRLFGLLGGKKEIQLSMQDVNVLSQMPKDIRTILIKYLGIKLVQQKQIQKKRCCNCIIL